MRSERSCISGLSKRAARRVGRGGNRADWRFPCDCESTRDAPRSCSRRSKAPTRSRSLSFMTHKSSRVSGQVEVPQHMVERVRALCLALPEVTVRIDESLTRTRSTAQSFDIRRRSFCLLVAKEGPTGNSIPLLVLRADPDERDALLSIGRPFFTPRVSRGRIGVLLTEDTDWEGVRELVTESYRVLAPKKLAALLD
ncbi:MAG: MmcQ/YjbR family DNA-binding protein [Acidimicrobiales bacterium]